MDDDRSSGKSRSLAQHGSVRASNGSGDKMNDATANANIQPVAWMMVNHAHPQSTKSLHFVPPTHWHITWKAEPLYDQAALDAAVAAERERCAVVLEMLGHSGCAAIVRAQGSPQRGA